MVSSGCVICMLLAFTSLQLIVNGQHFSSTWEVNAALSVSGQTASITLLSDNGLLKVQNLLTGNDRLAEPLEKAATWLLNQRNQDLNWGHLANAHALLAISRSHLNLSTPEIQLAVKQLDINFLHDRLRHGELELYSDRLIPLAVTLTSLCRNPTNYYDYDLLDGFLDPRRGTENFTFASELLAVCGGDGIIRRAHVRRLLKLLTPKLWTSPSASIDTVSMLIMAAGCVAKHHGQQSIMPFVDQVVIVLQNKQETDGSFASNTVSTALAIQALQIKGLSVDVNQTINAAVDWLVSCQQEDGSFDFDASIMSTIEVMLAFSPIGGRSYIHTSHCSRNETVHSIVPINNQSSKSVFRCNIWIGQPTILRQSFQLEIPSNLTLYQALQTAQHQGLLRFESREYSFGHYIVSINNVTEQAPTQQRWMIYILPDDLDSVKPDKKFLMRNAVSSYKLKKSEHILFWFQQVMQH